MSMSNAAEQALLDLLFLNTDWANVGDAGGLQNSATAGSFYVALHTADPGEAGDQTTSEAAYTSYARVAVARSAGGWTRTTSTIANTALVQFPQCSGSSALCTHFSIGVAAGYVQYAWGAGDTGAVGGYVAEWVCDFSGLALTVPTNGYVTVQVVDALGV